ncbi:hypothetical protein AMTRI_Chr02g257750 [Amborella trichopoda]
MKFLIWNERGLGQASRKSVARAYTSKLSPSILDLIETKLPDPNLQLVRCVWGKRPCQWISMPVIGASGGIWVVWDPSDLTLNNYHIGNFSWKFTAVYRPNSSSLRQSSWTELDHISSLPHPIWCLGGNFNVTRWSYERNTSSSIFQEKRDFSDFISRNDLLDIPLKGCQFTWSNHSSSPTLSKLDMFLTSIDWDEKFLKTTSQALPKPASDHCPILLDTNAIHKGPSPFRFELHWL